MNHFCFQEEILGANLVTFHDFLLLSKVWKRREWREQLSNDSQLQLHW